MIDEAADLNNKKQNSGIGFLNRDGENNSEGGLDEEEDLLEQVIPKKPTRTLDSDSEEEIKQKDENNPEVAHANKSNGLSASNKIAEMGLSRTSAND